MAWHRVVTPPTSYLVTLATDCQLVKFSREKRAKSSIFFIWLGAVPRHLLPTSYIVTLTTDCHLESEIFAGVMILSLPLFAGRNQISWNDGFQLWVTEQIIALLKEVWLRNVRHDIKYVKERTAMYVLPNKRKREKATRFPILLIYEILPKTSSHTVLPIFFPW